RKLSMVEELKFGSDGYVFLPKGSYKIQYKEVVSIPKDVVAWVLPRSSLLRCGVTIESAVWDPGYTGRGEGLMIVMNEHGFALKHNAKVGQMVFLQLVEEANEGYSGAYQGENI
ncbi:MAG: deoxyuridine 5'-triphosphate nucleotidohydrolase, partial [Candidatus Micrarchaeia archaeon]